MGRQSRSSGRFSVLLVVGIVVAILAAWLVYVAVRAAAPTQAVLVAARDIAPFSRVTPADFTMEMRPRSAVPRDALLDREAVSGLVTRGAMLKGDIIRSGHLGAQSGSALTASLAHTPERRIISLTAEALEGLGSQVAVGDYLDILGVMQINNGRTNEARAGVLATYAPIISVVAPPREGGLSGTGANTVLVSVTPEEAQAIKLAQATGKVYVQVSTQAEAARPPVMTPERVLRSEGEAIGR